MKDMYLIRKILPKNMIFVIATSVDELTRDGIDIAPKMII
jgi:hypothetical protein